MEKPSKFAPEHLVVEGADDVCFFGALQTEMYKNGELRNRAYANMIEGRTAKQWKKMLK